MSDSNKSSRWMAHLKNDIYPTYETPFQETPEQPSDTMKYEIRHQNPINVQDLQRHLPDMKISSDDDIITIIGIPPDNDFDETSVLEVVQKYDESATLVSHQLA